MDQFTTIKIKVWQTQESTTTEEAFDDAIDRAEMSADLGDEVDELLQEKLLEVGFDTIEEGVYFTFN